MYLGQTTQSPNGERPASWLALALVAVSAFGVALCITLLFHGMRGVLDLGGFVAYGGPYEIAHPAPGWVWVIPVSIVSGFAFGGLNAVAAYSARGFNLVPAIWAGLFAALGWNFLEYGFRPPDGGGVAWTWVVCGVVFWLMAIPVIPGVVGGRLILERMGVMAAQDSSGGAAGRLAWRRRYRPGYVALNVVCIGAGVVAGTLAFRALAG